MSATSAGNLRKPLGGLTKSIIYCFRRESLFDSFSEKNKYYGSGAYMPVFFTVDRRETLRLGSIIKLSHYDDISISDIHEMPKFKTLYDENDPAGELQNHINSLFPGGISFHGNEYFLNSHATTQLASPLIELIFEYVRRSVFPDAPSRFQSVFACDSIENAKKFRDIYGFGSIWKLKCESSFQADMNLLTLGEQASILTISYSSHRYWAGLKSIGKSPFWEYLLSPPIYVVEEIDE